jgi:hypothetical protein
MLLNPLTSKIPPSGVKDTSAKNSPIAYRALLTPRGYAPDKLARFPNSIGPFILVQEIKLALGPGYTIAVGALWAMIKIKQCCQLLWPFRCHSLFQSVSW